MNSPLESTSEFDILAEAVDEQPIIATVAQADIWQKYGLSRTWVAIGGLGVSLVLFLAVGLIGLILISTPSVPRNSPSDYPSYGQQGFGMTPGGAGIQQTPDGGYIDSQGGWGSGTGMSSGAIDQSGGGNDVFSSGGEVLTLPY